MAECSHCGGTGACQHPYHTGIFGADGPNMLDVVFGECPNCHAGNSEHPGDCPHCDTERGILIDRVRKVDAITTESDDTSGGFWENIGEKGAQIGGIVGALVGLLSAVTSGYSAGWTLTYTVIGAMVGGALCGLLTRFFPIIVFLFITAAVLKACSG